jgi:hypothetical protein
MSSQRRTAAGATAESLLVEKGSISPTWRALFMRARIARRGPAGKPYRRPDGGAIACDALCASPEPRVRRWAPPFDPFDTLRASKLRVTPSKAEGPLRRFMRLWRTRPLARWDIGPPEVLAPIGRGLLLCEVAKLPPSRTTKSRYGGRRRLRYEARAGAPLAAPAQPHSSRVASRGQRSGEAGSRNVSFSAALPRCTLFKRSMNNPGGHEGR